MRNMVVFFLVAIFVISVVRVGSVGSSVAKPGGELEMLVNAKNIGDSKEHDLRLRVFFPDFGEYLTSNQLDIKAGRSVARMFFTDVPFDIEPGFYPVKITLSNDEQRSVKYHWIEIV